MGPSGMHALIQCTPAYKIFPIINTLYDTMILRLHIVPVYIGVAMNVDA